MTLAQFFRATLALVQSFFHWWGTELAACLPQWLRIERAWSGNDLVLHLDEHEGVLARERADGSVEILERLAAGAKGGTERRGAAVRLRLPAERALRLVLPLPAAALENLRDAVSFQLDRYTPFEASQVYLACTAGEREDDGDRVAVAATLVERPIVARAIASAQQLGFAIRAVEVEGAGPRAKADPLPLPELRTRSRGQFALTAAAALLLVALAVAAASYPFVREEARAAAVQQRLAAARTKAEAAQKLEQEIDAEKAAANFLVDRKHATPMALDLLAELTRIAPDDTWLSSASYSGKEIQITGLARSASALLGRFEQSKLFKNAQFRSPVTPDAASGDEHFVISVGVAGAGPSP